MNKKGIYLSINVLLILILFITQAAFNLVNLINAVFYVSFANLIIMLFLYTVRGGFYDGITFSFRRFWSIMSPSKDYMDEWKEKPMPSEKTNESFYAQIKFQTTVLFTFFAFLLLIYYIF
ncbi:DUF3899 domain-containing protein [Oceanobacillus halophilus]|uniref:DUF3899 domain-containing protein n=1 Tax=Oceanobacillus halophilus TaxID=930130 RepID=A0A495A1T5_9BACI|nr:DUF3899 domain-containing protein [Oceanobacillus halophilus]RKQ33442.1 DUF3899 domain-containing protein [Oceanobacillus halophilus]